MEDKFDRLRKLMGGFTREQKEIIREILLLVLEIAQSPLNI